MTELRLNRHSYRYFPYELELGRREVRKLLDETAAEWDFGFVAKLNGHSLELLRRFTYMRSATLPDGTTMLTDQARLEDSARRNGGLIPDIGPHRQSTRYSAHGLHEYRGKFNPQVVRAVGNLLGLQEGAWVVDPFCGSGTSLLESAHCGWNCIGVDMNPLAVLISNAKIQAVNTPGDLLVSEVTSFTTVLERKVSGLQFDSAWDDRIEHKLARNGWESDLPNFEYLQNWFPRSVLAQFAVVFQLIREHEAIGDILRVVVSDLARTVSMQDPGDLRIRRRKQPRANYPLIPLLIEGATARVSTIARAQSALKPRGRQLALLGDSRENLKPLLIRSGAPELVDAAITSPPYATALPYIDTQRLSLALLGLLQVPDVAALDSQLVGTREVTRRQRLRLESEINTAASIPEDAREVCSAMLKAVKSSATDGFRRRNMPALVFQYFQGMATVFSNMAQVVKPGGHFVLVVGRNRTVLGGEEFSVDTPKLLVDTAHMTGWSCESQLELETYQRFDVHQRNSIRTETMVILRRKPAAPNRNGAPRLEKGIVSEPSVEL